MNNKIQPLFIFAPTILLLCIWQLVGFPIYPDNFLLSFIAESAVNGGTYTHDFIDVSPPVGFWYFAPAYFVTKVIGFSLELSMALYLSLIPLLSCYLIRTQVKDTNLQSLSYLVPIALTTFFYANMGTALSKDHISILLLLPWIISSAFGIKASFIVVFVGCLGVLGKPQFLVVFAALTLIDLHAFRDRKHFFTTYITMATLGTLYVAHTYVVHPEFFSNLKTTLWLYDASMSYQFFGFRLQSSVLYLILMLTIPFYNYNYKAHHYRLLIVTLCFLVVAILQNKAIEYHFDMCEIIITVQLVFIIAHQAKTKRVAVLVSTLYFLILSNVGDSINHYSRYYQDYQKDLKAVSHLEGEYWQLACNTGFGYMIPIHTDLRYNLVFHSAWPLCKGFGTVTDDKVKHYLDVAFKEIDTKQIPYFVYVEDHSDKDPILNELFDKLDAKLPLNIIHKIKKSNKTVWIYEIERK